MLLFVVDWLRRLRNKRDGISTEADDLILNFGVNAYEEARRRRYESNDLASARYWGAVKSEIGRRILEECGDSDNLRTLEPRLHHADVFTYAILTQAAEGRLESRRLANVIETARAALTDNINAGSAAGRRSVGKLGGALLRRIKRSEEELEGILSHSDKANCRAEGTLA